MPFTSIVYAKTKRNPIQELFWVPQRQRNIPLPRSNNQQDYLCPINERLTAVPPPIDQAVRMVGRAVPTPGDQKHAL